MAGFQPWQDGCIEIVFRFTLFGIPLVIVIAVCLDSGAIPTTTQVDNIAGAADDWMHFDMMSVLSSDLKFLETQATDKHVATAYQKTISHGAGIAGSIGAPSISSQLAGVVTLYTPLRGRNYRGRTFLPGIPSTYVDAGTSSDTLTTASVATILTEYNALDGRLAPFSAKQHVMSRVASKVERPIALGQPVTSRAMDDIIDTIRRRGANAHR